MLRWLKNDYGDIQPFLWEWDCKRAKMKKATLLLLRRNQVSKTRRRESRGRRRRRRRAERRGWREREATFRALFLGFFFLDGALMPSSLGSDHRPPPDSIRRLDAVWLTLCLCRSWQCLPSLARSHILLCNIRLQTASVDSCEQMPAATITRLLAVHLNLPKCVASSVDVGASKYTRYYI
jgi:hypothetical protein